MLGSDGAFSPTFVPLDQLDGSSVFRISAGPSDNHVVSVLPVGDFNGDGYSDLIVTTSDSTARTSTAESPVHRQLHVVYGQAAPFAADFDIVYSTATMGSPSRSMILRYCNDLPGRVLVTSTVTDLTISSWGRRMLHWEQTPTMVRSTLFLGAVNLIRSSIPGIRCRPRRSTEP